MPPSWVVHAVTCNTLHASRHADLLEEQTQNDADHDVIHRQAHDHSPSRLVPGMAAPLVVQRRGRCHRLGSVGSGASLRLPT